MYLWSRAAVNSFSPSFAVIFAFAICLLLARASNAQCIPTLTPDPPVSANGVTTYTYVLTTCNAAAGPPVRQAVQSLRLEVNTAFLPVTSVAGGTFTQSIIPGEGVNLSFTAPSVAGYTFAIAAQTNLSSAPTQARYTVTFADGITTMTGLVNVPAFQTPDKITGLTEVANDESTIDVLIGVGSHTTFATYPDYNLAASSVLVSTGIGHAIPEMLLGAGFTTGAYKIRTTCIPLNSHCVGRKLGRHILPDSIFVNTQIPVGASSSAGNISGFTFGGGFKIQKFVEVLVGFSLAPYNEPSTGFRNAAAAVVSANAALPVPQQVPIYLQYRASDILAGKPNSLDGFPILQQQLNGAPGGQIYQGSALLNHYRGGLFIGLAYPFSLSKLFQH